MQREVQREEARNVIAGALRLAKERVVGDLDEKEIQRERLADLIVRMAGQDNQPTAQDLEAALGDPDDKEVREAIRSWSQEDAPVTPQ